MGYCRGMEAYRYDLPLEEVCGPGIVRGSDVLTVLGCGHTLVSDVLRYGVRGDVLAVSHAAAFYPGVVRHCCSNHCREILQPLLKLRRAARYPEVEHVHALAGDRASGVTHYWRLAPGPRTSGDFARMLGLAMGYSHIRLLGMPEDGGGHFYAIPTGREAHQRP